MLRLSAAAQRPHTSLPPTTTASYPSSTPTPNIHRAIPLPTAAFAAPQLLTPNDHHSDTEALNAASILLTFSPPAQLDARLTPPREESSAPLDWLLHLFGSHKSVSAPEAGDATTPRDQTPLRDTQLQSSSPGLIPTSIPIPDQNKGVISNAGDAGQMDLDERMVSAGPVLRTNWTLKVLAVFSIGVALAL